MSDARYTFWQQVFPFLRGSWTCPPVDVVDALPRDRRIAHPAGPAWWPASLADVPVKFGGRRTPVAGTVPGKPVQWAGTRREAWTVADPWVNETYTFSMPVPLASGSRIVQGYPLHDGAYDRTAVIVDADEVTETILTFPDRRTVGRMARWTHDGRLVAGRPITRSHQPVFRTILGMREPAHRLAMSIPDYSRYGNAYGGDATQTDGTGDFDWPRAGSLIRLTVEALGRAIETGGQVERVARMAHVHGVVIIDRAGPTVPHAGIHGQWGGWTEQHQPWTLADFEPAIDDDQPRYGEDTYQ